MGVQTHTASRIYKGQKMGKSGEDEILEWEKFPYTGQSKTYNTDFQVSMTSLVSDIRSYFLQDGGIYPRVNPGHF